VRYEGGPKIGRVESVKIDPKDPTFMDMEFSVKEDLPIKTDSRVAILSFSPLGDNHLEIRAGSLAAPRATDGAVLPADQYVGFNELTAEINQVMPQAQELMGNLNLRMKDLSVTLTRVNDLLNDQNRANISASISELQGMLREDRPVIKSTLNNVSGASAKLAPMLDDLKKTSDQANETLKKFDAMLGENREDLHASIKKLREALNSVSSITKRVDQTLDINSETIDELLMNMRDVSENLKEFTDIIKTRPSELIRSTSPHVHKPGEHP
jgi:phospholipid/cholesterol/gamma-HCH transport system substrate-binding protein